MAASTDNVLHIPLTSNPDEAVQVPLDALPQDISDVTDILVMEAAPLSLWDDFATEYYKRGHFRSFEQILRRTLEADAVSFHDNQVALNPEAQAELKRQRVKIYCHLAFGELLRASRASLSDPKVRQSHLAEATQLLNEATKLKVDPARTSVLKGLLTRLKSEGQREGRTFSSLTQKTTHFDQALRLEPRNISALLGRAEIFFEHKEYSRCLQDLARALRVNPALPPDIRFGIGLCHARLGSSDLALKSFRRVLQLDPSHPRALTASAVLLWENVMTSARQRRKAGQQTSPTGAAAAATDSRADDQDSGLTEEEKQQLQESGSLLERSLLLSPEDPATLVYLARHLHFVGQGSQAVRLAFRVLHSGPPADQPQESEAFLQLRESLGDRLLDLESSETQENGAPGSTGKRPVSRLYRAMAARLIAEVYHLQNQFDKAYEFYVQADHLQPNHPVTQFALAQMHLHRGEAKAAIELLRKVRGRFPKHAETLHLLGCALAEVSQWKEAREILLEAGSLAPEHLTLQLDLAAVAQTFYPQDAVAAYMKAIRLLLKRSSKSGARLPVPLLHNFAVCCQRLCRSTEALKAYVKALRLLYVAHNQNRHQYAESSEAPNPDAMVDDGEEGSPMRGIPQKEIQISDAVLEQLRGVCWPIPEARGEAATAEIRREVEEDGEVRSVYSLRTVAGVPVLRETVSAWYNLALLREELGQLEEAVQIHRAILETAPDYVDSLLRLSLLRRAQGNLPEALQKVESAVELCQRRLDEHLYAMPLDDIEQGETPHQSNSGEDFWKEQLRRANTVKAETLFAMEDWPRARNLIVELLQSRPGDAWAQLLMGSLLCQEDTDLESGGPGGRSVVPGSPAGGAAAPGGSSSWAYLRKEGLLMVSDGHVKSGGGSRRRENIHNAGQYFLKVLEAQPESLVAAVGLGVVLTEKSRLSEAVKIFSRIRETAGNSQMPGPGVTHAYLESLLNLAHLYSHSEKPENERQYDVAIKLYELYLKLYQQMQSFSTAADIKAQRRIKQHTISFQPASALQLKRVLDRRAEVYLYMARAQYLAGEMIPARVSLSKGLQLQPQHPLLWYNLALVQEEFAIKVLATDKDRRSLADVQRAIDELEQATATFARLSGFVDKSKRDRRARPPAEDPEIKGNVPLEMDLDARARRALETPTPGYISQRARKHHEFCVSAVEQAQPHLNYAQAQEQRKRQLHEQGVRQQELWRREQEEKKERERQEREAEEARQREVLKELAEISHRIAQRQAELEDDDEKEGADMADGGPDADQQDEDWGPSGSRKRKKPEAPIPDDLKNFLEAEEEEESGTSTAVVSDLSEPSLKRIKATEPETDTRAEAGTDEEKEEEEEIDTKELFGSDDDDDDES